MKIPEKSPRIVSEAPPREAGEVLTPVVFQRSFQHSRVVLCIAVMIGYLVALLLLLFASVGLSEGEFIGVAVVFGLFGLFALVASLKGSWTIASGPKVHFLSLEPDDIVWGCRGEEQRLRISDIASIYYTVDTDSDGASNLSLTFKTHDDERFSVQQMNYLVPRKLRPKLLAFLKTSYPGTTLHISDS